MVNRLLTRTAGGTGQTAVTVTEEALHYTPKVFATTVIGPIFVRDIVILPSSRNTSQLKYLFAILRTPKKNHKRDQRITHLDNLSFDCLVEVSADCQLFGGLGGALVRNIRNSDGNFTAAASVGPR